jgi:hypothetical protein
VPFEELLDLFEEFEEFEEFPSKEFEGKLLKK